MKTPQEQAEELVGRIKPYEVMCKCTYCRKEIATILRETALPELIAVARTTASDKKDEECTCGTDPERSCRYCGYFIRLDRALQALRATGKGEVVNNPLITAMLVAAFPYENGFRNEPTYRNTVQTYEEGKKCLLPDCGKQTKHNGGYCCADHCKLHRAKMKGTK